MDAGWMDVWPDIINLTSQIAPETTKGHCLDRQELIDAILAPLPSKPALFDTTKPAPPNQ
jgi:hypothetical protein